jgi:putative ABC transport system substrate-binding protein
MRFVKDNNRLGASAQEIVATSLPATKAAQQSTRIIPIVFVSGGDPNNNGLVKNVARPEGNITGFVSFFTATSGKWLELLKEAVPSITRVALIFNPRSEA